MQKKTPHYKLNMIKALIRSDKFIITGSARKTAAEDFAFTEEQIVKFILNLDRKDFYKSMTSYNDHSLWHDVYKCQLSEDLKAYIKLQIVSETTVIVSFKEE